MSKLHFHESGEAEPIAVIGIGCRFPGAADVAAFWRLLRDGRDAITEVPPGRFDADFLESARVPARQKAALRWGGFVDGVDQFDPYFFGISPREAAFIDPQHRLLLEAAWEALEDAGLPPTGLSGSSTGVFVGLSFNDYEDLLFRRHRQLNLRVTSGGSRFSAAGRLSFSLNLEGPSLMTDTACSSSLTAVHLACQSLRNRECTLALAGGVNLILQPHVNICLSRGDVLAPDGHCKFGDAHADGYGRSEGVGVVVLKPLDVALADGDPIYAVIRGSAVNHKGNKDGGIVAPSRESLEQVMRSAFAQAGLAPACAHYIEAHGTGTVVGDLAEIPAIGAVVAEGRPADRPCWIGSVKTNIGHAESASGIAALIKVALCFKHGQIPPSLHFHEPNPEIPWEALPVRMITQSQAWPGEPGPFFVGINNFGISGTNAHVVLASPPLPAVSRECRGPQLLCLSARTEPAVRALAGQYADHLESHADVSLADVCFMAGAGRSHFAHRVAVVADSIDRLRDALRSFAAGRAAEGCVGGTAETADSGVAVMPRIDDPNRASQLTDLARAYVGGATLDWAAVQAGGVGRCHGLPTYPFERRRYWVSPEAPVRSSAREPVVRSEWLYELQWEPRRQAKREAAPPAAVAERVEGGARHRDLTGAMAVYESLVPELDALSVAYVLEAFEDLGWALVIGERFSVAERIERLGIVPAHHRLFARLVGILAEAGLVRAADDTWHVVREPDWTQAESHRAGLLEMYPSCSAEFDLLGRCGIRLADVLRGRCSPLDLLFPNGSLAELETFYERAPFARAANGLVCESLAHILAEWPADRPIRILELGAGTGATTAGVLPMVPAGRTEYVFTDVSPLFAKQAQRKFAACAFVEYGLLDVECDPATQGFAERQFDVVLAANVLHATADLRQTLRHVRSLVAPGGWLMLSEVTSRPRWADLIFGLTEGWWKFTDHDLRPDYPLLDSATWLRVLAETSLSTPAAVRAGNAAFDQSVLLARAAAGESRHWLFFADQGGVAAATASRLREQGDVCTLVHAAGQCQDTTTDERTIDPHRSEQYDALMQATAAGSAGPVHVAYFWGLDVPSSEELNSESLDAAYALGCCGALRAMQAMQRCEGPRAGRLWLVTRGAQAVRRAERLSTAQAPLWGFGRTVALEEPTRWGGLVDLDADAVVEMNAAALASELTAPDGEDQTAWRNGHRFVARLLPREVKPAVAEPLRLRVDASYLITGGLGRLGLLVARWLVDCGARHLVLMQRSAPTDAAGAVLRTFEAAGVRVHVVQGDVACTADVERLFDEIRGNLPPLRGVVHAAGVTRFDALTDMSAESLEAVLRPKCAGAWNLHRATQRCELDFFVLFSSAAAIWGSRHMAHYAAANHFLDALAHERRANGLPALSVNWARLSERGMQSAELETSLARIGIEAIPTEAAFTVLGELIRENAVQAICADVDWARFRPVFQAKMRRPLLDRIVVAPAESEAVADVPAPALKESLVFGSMAERRSTLVNHIRAEVADVLGFDEDHPVDVRRGFFELGMDSLTAVELKGRLERATGQTFASSLLFEHSTIEQLADAIAQGLTGGDVAPRISASPTRFAGEEGASDSIAIIGMGCRFPGGVADPDAFWDLLRAGGDAVAEITPQRLALGVFGDASADTPGGQRGGFLTDIEWFDADFFGIAPREAAHMDPQQRLLLEVGSEALERAGVASDTLAGSRTGVFIGLTANDYRQVLTRASRPDDLTGHALMGHALNAAAGRLSYFLGLHGPSLVVDTACSSSLVAVHLACQSLRTGECRMALAGGANVILSSDMTSVASRTNLLSPEGRCKTFDASADGFVRSEGCGIVVLKRLADALADGDGVLAIICGSAVNQDGPSSGFTVPNGAAQQALIRDALANAHAEPAQIGYVEAHGTGTSLGDPIEVRALAGVFRGSRPADWPLHIGSVKTNIGHAESAAGIAGLMKVVLMLQHGEIPPHLHLRQVNPEIDLDAMPAVVPTTCTPWPVDDRPRLAGVSAFGASGTNAHVILEQAPSLVPVPEGNPSASELLCISARTESALCALAGRYAMYLECHPDVPLEAICFTANTGRRHFEHRLAIVATSRDDLRQRLAAFADGKGGPQEAVGQVNSLDVHGPLPCESCDRKRHLEQTAEAYAAGASIDWSLVYGDARFPRVPLPTYPFERERLWVDGLPVGQSVRGAGRADDVHPLLGRRVRSASGEHRFQAVLRPSRPAYLADHHVGDLALFPAAGYVEMALAAAGQVFAGDSVQVTGLRLHAPLPLEDGSARAVEMTVRPRSPDEADFEIRSVVADVLNHGAAWTLHVSGMIRSTPMDLDGPRHVSYAERRADCPQTLAADAFYRDLDAKGLGFGPAFRGLHRVWVGHGQSLALVNLPASLQHEADAYRIHPVLLDACWQAAGVLLHESRHGAEAVPVAVGVDEFRLFAPAGQRLYSHVVRHDDSQAESDEAVFDATLFTESGRIIAETCGLHLKFVAAPRVESADATDVNELLYAVQWEPSAATPSASLPAGRWLIFADKGGVAAALATRMEASGSRVICVRPGQRYGQTGAGEWEIDPAKPDDVARLLEEIGISSTDPIVGVVYLWAIDLAVEVEPTTVTLESGQAMVCGGALHLVQAMISANLSPVAGLWLATLAAQSVDVEFGRANVAQAPLWGFGRVLASEHPELHSRLIDLDADLDAGVVAAALVMALRADDGEDQVAHRAGNRYVARLVRSGPPAVPREPTCMRADGTYLITGGLGGLGQAVARWLVERGARHLVLMGRGGPSEAARDMLRELEAAGAHVRVLRGDVAREADVWRVLSEIGAAMPALCGVIHAAGVLDDGVLVHQSWERFATVMAPKVFGAWNLHRLTADRPLDFFVLFSSAVGLLGSAGQANHAAASVFLDALAQYRRKQGLPALSLDWGAWGDVGAVVNQDVGGWMARRGVGIIAPQQALAALGYLMQADSPPQVGVLRIDWQTFLEPVSLGAGSSLLRGLREAAPSVLAEAACPSAFLERLRASPARQRKELLHGHVRAMTAKALGLGADRPIDPKRPLKEMGLDSLLAIELRKALATSLDCTLPATLLFNCPTVEALGEHLAALLLRPGAAEPPPGPALQHHAAGQSVRAEELGALSEAELERLLIEKLNAMQERRSE
ncbi:MAG: SDR family NAD(P)-dependent oxidoreductase [Phycisphaerae bacterium]|nr:SDR family NAD(P)-dependent oxidoreductase [Phycisphaerae bacterium]